MQRFHLDISVEYIEKQTRRSHENNECCHCFVKCFLQLPHTKLVKYILLSKINDNELLS